VARCEGRGEVRGTWRGARDVARCEGRGKVRGTWRGGVAVTIKMTRFQAHGCRVYSAYISSKSTAASQKCLAMMLLACGATISGRTSFSQILKG